LIPFSRVTIEYVAEKLSISPPEVEALVIKLRLAKNNGGLLLDAVAGCIVNPRHNETKVCDRLQRDSPHLLHVTHPLHAT